MILVVASLLLGLVPTADRPRAPERDRHAPASLAGAPAPRELAPAVRVRLRARAPEREEDPSQLALATTEPVSPPPASRRPWRGVPFDPEPSLAALIYALCTLVC
jgi:hypothetical protein